MTNDERYNRQITFAMMKPAQQTRIVNEDHSEAISEHAMRFPVQMMCCGRRYATIQSSSEHDYLECLAEVPSFAVYPERPQSLAPAYCEVPNPASNGAETCALPKGHAGRHGKSVNFEGWV